MRTRRPSTAYLGCRDLVRESLLRRNVPPQAINIMLSSLSDNSIKQYDTYLKKWHLFCNSNDNCVFELSVPKIISFLTQLFENGAQYNTINSCKSALSLIFGPQLCNDDRIKRFLKGVFRLRPPLPKYNQTWNTSTVLDHLSSWYPNENLSLDQISKKMTTLLALVTAHRAQTLTKILINNIEFQPDKVIIKIPSLIKTSRAGAAQPILSLPYFNEKPQICPVKTLSAYLDKTKLLRDNQQPLFIGLKKPHKSVTSQTISRWIRLTLGECGIDTTIFTAHSTRHASTSKAHSLGVSLDLIRKTAGWSGSSSVFGKFYNKYIPSNNESSFARSIMSNNLVND
ncbi:uncharacterized protein LOC126378473 isoform X1 [Pectinophora gossypiella]|uniref:uncharacterized protein LOC126378473 isoform X1 n=1 Tax=Pectinophora gossypiella TaxID=13191 RepID=UPI00214E272A|nr:uncharacterized protein LOC126378473 isoform X1 [Pectinophora gossypiella]